MGDCVKHDTEHDDSHQVEQGLDDPVHADEHGRADDGQHRGKGEVLSTEEVNVGMGFM